MLHFIPALEIIPSRSSVIFLAGLLFAAAAYPTQAQTERAEDAFYSKFGAGFSEYTGDLPTRYERHPFDLRGFTGGTGFPFIFAGELGYQFSPTLALALGLQAGAYPFVGVQGGPDDQWRYTPQLLGRYTFGAETWTVAPYLDAGANVTFGGDTSTGYGPSAGAGLDILLSRRLSFYVETRFNLTFPDDAVDGANFAPDSFDLLNQLLGFGLKVNLVTLTAPQVVAFDGPAEVQTGEPATFTASVNENEATRPLTYRWQFGDGTTGSGLTASHTYDQPGTYTVTFTASNEAGESSESLTVEAEVPPQPPRVAALDGPAEVQTGEPATFTASVNENEATRPLTYRWQFGDGTTGSGLTASHTYDQPGTYTVTFTASNDLGEASESLQVTVTTSEPQPAHVASVSADPNPVNVGKPVRFSSNVQGDSPLTYAWSFGDGSTATGRSPTHTYEKPGQYTARLKASNEAGMDSSAVIVRVQVSTERWTIVVASMSTEDEAEAMAEKYRDRFPSELLPVKIMTAKLKQGTRHRVGLGQFENFDAAYQVLKKYEEKLPSGAWLLPLQ